MARVLITGASGFTGRYLVKELIDDGHFVTQLDSSNKFDDQQLITLNSSDKQTISVNLMDLGALTRAIEVSRPEMVIHLAGIAFVGHDDPNGFYNINLIGTRNLLQALHNAKAEPERVILASSANVYGNTLCDSIDEACPVQPLNDYAASKAAMEMVAKLWFDRFPIVIARPFNYTGVGQSDSFLVPKIVAHFSRRSSQIKLGNMDVWRDYSDVRWMAAAYRALMLAGSPGGTYNLGSGTPISINEIIRKLEDFSGYRIEVISDPALIRKNELYRVCADTTKIKNIASIPRPMDFEKTLLWMYEGALLESRLS